MVHVVGSCMDVSATSNLLNSLMKLILGTHAGGHPVCCLYHNINGDRRVFHCGILFMNVKFAFFYIWAGGLDQGRRVVVNIKTFFYIAVGRSKQGRSGHEKQTI